MVAELARVRQDKPEVHTCIETTWLWVIRMLLEARERPKVDCPPAKLDRLALIRVTHHFIGIRSVEHGDKETI